MRKRWIVLAPLALAAFALFVALGGEIVRQLWNWLLPPLFGWRTITFWQALGLLALCRILFGGLGFHGSSRSGRRRLVAERWDSLTAEERERFRQHVRERWGAGGSTSEEKGR
jgi:hypothetical protein